MKAIETSYKGYRFRSRLEARWAVFFDALGISWTYEPQGFDLGNGEQYLPDFHLVKLDTWVEVKGTPPNFGDKCYTFKDEMRMRGVKVFVVIGDPPGMRGSCNLLDHLRSSGIGTQLTLLAISEAREARFG